MKQISKSENSPLLVAAGKSSRLEAIKQKAGLKGATTNVDKKLKKSVFILGLNPVTRDALQQATVMVDERMESIINGYPDGKKNTFFKLKYGVKVDKVKGLLIADIFKLLILDANSIKHYALIEKLYLDGKTVDAE